MASSTRGSRRSRRVGDQLDLTGVTPEEFERIMGVIERDQHLNQVEQERLQYAYLFLFTHPPPLGFETQSLHVGLELKFSLNSLSLALKTRYPTLCPDKKPHSQAHRL